MESNSWTRFSTSSKRFQSRSGPGGEEYFESGEDESLSEYLCPFCAENFDIVGLCCHIDEEHAVEAKNGVCPICVKRGGFDLIDHVIVQHGKLLKCKRKSRKRGSNGSLSFSRKEQGDGKMQFFLGGSSCLSSSTPQPDPLLSSFICSPPSVHELPIVEPPCSNEKSLNEEPSINNVSDRDSITSASSYTDEEEKARKCEFVQGLLLSTFLDDSL